VPVIESSHYLARLEARLHARGVRLEVAEVKRLEEVRQPGRIVVVCTGLGARELLADEALFPIQGQVVRVTNPGIGRVTLDEDDARALTYIIPRRNDCILGGSARDGVWDTMPDPEQTEAILRRARRLEPALERAEVLDVQVGLRPGRSAVRLAVEAHAGRGAVISNVGHGGSGYTLAWGCADEVLAHVQSLAEGRAWEGAEA
jgi:D-amino-acid oxidase